MKSFSQFYDIPKKLDLPEFKTVNLEDVYDLLEKRVDTTLSAAITELFPALAFNKGYKPRSVADFQAFIYKHNLKDKAFVNNADVASAKGFIERMAEELTPKLLETKFQNAIGITKWLYDLHRQKPISLVQWGYRAKPKGVPSNHAGDIFIFHKDKSIVGVSLKAGTSSSKEPLLNSYVKTQLNYMGRDNYLPKLYSEMWKRVYSKLPELDEVGANESNYYSGKVKTGVLTKYMKLFVQNQVVADNLYHEMVLVNREVMIEAINSLSLTEFKSWVSERFNLQKPQDVPLILVKAVGTSAEQKSDDLATIINTVSSFKAVMNTASVQEFYIVLNAPNVDAMTLKMTIRSDSGVRESKAPNKQGRLGKMAMLKFQYSGKV